MTISNEVIEFYERFHAPLALPAGVELHNPFLDLQRKEAITAFCNKFYNDEVSRIHLLGINPSKISTTSSGVNYTDGFALENYCDIPNNFSKSREVTAKFFYSVVNAMGGAQKFYNGVFAWALMPISITKSASYVNHYDPQLANALDKTILTNLEWLKAKIPCTDRVVILGLGENKKAFKALKGYPFGYSDIRYLPHPRWVMQYKSAYIDKYINEYKAALT